MKKIRSLFFICLLSVAQLSVAQEKPLQLSLGTIKTVLKENAIDFGIKYLQSYDSLFQQQDILFAGKNNLFQFSPEFNVQSGTGDAFSSVNLKLTGLLMFFQTTEISEVITPCTNCYMHLLPVSAGIETNNTFTVVNGIFEAGYVPWYQSPMMTKVPDWLKHTKAGIFVQAGYKFSRDTSIVESQGGQADESAEMEDDGILRLKGSFTIDTKSIFTISGVGIGIFGSANGWYDLLNNEVYYRLEGTMRFFLSASHDKSFNLNYQKGSGAPNFNQGDQFGMGLTLTF
ncbi:hypothetical protein OU798_00895 [Prolixibacteraceae bacterium Z1-6]|uniref:Uncharacterized protein n=1 Tax=Draconibacterium aestuarii TaxID=2998507 RepID=A0A9X3F2W8_9BACT|nr:hypothetical protein [Prolixibacteraceae bacterium Z1-6]